MCPACIATTAWIVAGSTSAGGFTAFVAFKWLKGLRIRRRILARSAHEQES